MKRGRGVSLLVDDTDGPTEHVGQGGAYEDIPRPHPPGPVGPWSQPARTGEGIDEKKNAPLPVERVGNHARVREQVSSARELPHAAVNPNANHPRACYRHRSRRAVGVPLPRLRLGVRYPRFSGRHIAQTIYLCWSCVPIPKTEKK